MTVVPTSTCWCWPNGAVVAPNGVEAAPPNESDELPKSPVLVGWLVVVEPKRPPADDTDGAPNADPAGLKAEPNLKLNIWFPFMLYQEIF